MNFEKPNEKDILNIINASSIIYKYPEYKIQIIPALQCVYEYVSAVISVYWISVRQHMRLYIF